MTKMWVAVRAGVDWQVVSNVYEVGDVVDRLFSEGV